MKRLKRHRIVRSTCGSLIVLFIIGVLAHRFRHQEALDMRLKMCKAQGTTKNDCWLDEQARELIQDTHDLESAVNTK